jgi:hypothetical protein
MKSHRWPLLGVGLSWLLAAGCTTLREIPRSQYASQPERRHVRLVTREGLVYEFDYIQVSGDSLIGYRRRDVEGPAEEFALVGLPLEEVQRLSARSVDWYRTGLIGGGVIAAFVAKGLTESSDKPEGGGGGGGGGPGHGTP